MAVYIATDSPISLIPWDVENRTLHVSELRGEPDEGVKSQFTKSNIYYIGSHLGCGCGFFYAAEPEYHEIKEIIESQNVIEKLKQLLIQITSEQGDVEFYACWEGEQKNPPENRGTIKATEL